MKQITLITFLLLASLKGFAGGYASDEQIERWLVGHTADAMNRAQRSNLSSVSASELTVVTDYLIYGDEALPPAMQADPFTVSRPDHTVSGYNSIQFSGGLKILKTGSTSTDFVIEMAKRNRVDLLERFLLTPPKEGAFAGFWYIRDAAVAQIVKIYQENPSDDSAIDALKRMMTEINANTRYIILDGVSKVRSNASLDIIWIHLNDKRAVTSGSGSTYLDYGDVLKRKATEALKKIQ